MKLEFTNFCISWSSAFLTQFTRFEPSLPSPVHLWRKYIFLKFNHFISWTIHHNVEFSCYFVLRKGETLLVLITWRCLVILTCIIPVSPPFRSDACIHLCVGIYHPCIWSPRTPQVHVWSVLANASNIAPTIYTQMFSSQYITPKIIIRLDSKEDNTCDRVMW